MTLHFSTGCKGERRVIQRKSQRKSHGARCQPPKCSGREFRRTPPLTSISMSAPVSRVGRIHHETESENCENRYSGGRVKSHLIFMYTFGFAIPATAEGLLILAIALVVLWIVVSVPVF